MRAAAPGCGAPHHPHRDAQLGCSQRFARPFSSLTLPQETPGTPPLPTQPSQGVGAASRGLSSPSSKPGGDGLLRGFPQEINAKNKELMREKFPLHEAGAAGLEGRQSQERPNLEAQGYGMRRRPSSGPLFGCPPCRSPSRSLYHPSTLGWFGSRVTGGRRRGLTRQGGDAPGVRTLESNPWLGSCSPNLFQAHMENLGLPVWEKHQPQPKPG